MLGKQPIFPKQVRDSLYKAFKFQSQNSDLNEQFIKSLVMQGYRELGFDGKPFLMNFGLSDQATENALLASLDETIIYSPFLDNYSMQLVYYTIKDYLLALDHPPEKVLDVGCGNGSTSLLLSHLLNSKQTIGLDLTYSQIQRATEYYQPKREGLYFCQGDAESLPFADRGFDAVINIESSHLYPNIDEFLNEVVRVLKPGGYFCFVDIIMKSKRQDLALKRRLKKDKNLQLVAKKNITKLVANAIYQRLVVNEKRFIAYWTKRLKNEYTILEKELPSLFEFFGVRFLPKRWLRFDTPGLADKIIADYKNSIVALGKGKYHYYCIKKQG